MKYTEIRGVSKPLHIFPIVSPTGTDHIQDNIAALDLALNDAECKYLNLEC